MDKICVFYAIHKECQQNIVSKFLLVYFLINWKKKKIIRYKHDLFLLPNEATFSITVGVYLIFIGVLIYSKPVQD